MAESMPIRIAYLGAGNMAQGMIRRLLGAGFDVTVWNRTPEKVVPLEASGARRAATPRAAAEGATIVMASVIDDQASRTVWLGPDGALEAGGPIARIAVEHSTLSHDWVMELSGLVRQRGWRYVDCPVAGRPNMSAAGELVVFAGADPRDLDEIRPVLKPMSKEIFHFGPPGSGTAFKLIYNLMGATQVVALAEGLVAAEAVGIDLRTAARAFSTGATGSPHVVRHAVFMAEGKHEDPPAFTGRGRLKDSLYGVQIANKHGIDVRIGQSTAAVFQEMVDGGLAAAADSRVIDVIRRRSGKPVGDKHQ
jgi:3-hydroxyisobutyrate dehydrogenase